MFRAVVPTSPAFLPLSLLEAVRNLDTPVEDGLELLAEDIVARRLGLSNTVAAQISRYKYTADRSGSVNDDELVSVLRLVGRRPDAALVFADAGRRAARYAVHASGRSTRALVRASPRFLGRRLASRALRRLAAAYFRGRADARRHGRGRADVAPALDERHARWRGLRLLRRGVRRAIPRAGRFRGHADARELRGPRRPGVSLADRARGGIRMSPFAGLDRVELRAGLEEAGADAWLLFDFRAVNPVAQRVLRLGGIGSRRIFVLFPARR